VGSELKAIVHPLRSNIYTGLHTLKSKISSVQEAFS